jgi:hypothetical protein
MALPIVNAPEYFLELPSTGKRVKYRPFVVREEKVLLLALESEDVAEMSNAVKNVLSSCVKGDNLNIETLPTFDIEYMFRGKAVGEEIELQLLCTDDGETYVKTKIFIDEIKVKKDPTHTNKIKINDDLMMEMRYPSLEQFIKSNFNFEDRKSQLEQSIELIASCVDKIYNQEGVWTSSDATTQEIVDFLEDLTSTQFSEIEKFFETMPKLEHKVQLKNPKTEVESTITLAGLTDFFG